MTIRWSSRWWKSDERPMNIPWNSDDNPMEFRRIFIASYDEYPKNLRHLFVLVSASSFFKTKKSTTQFMCFESVVSFSERRCAVKCALMTTWSYDSQNDAPRSTQLKQWYIPDVILKRWYSDVSRSNVSYIDVHVLYMHSNSFSQKLMRWTMNLAM